MMINGTSHVSSSVKITNHCLANSACKTYYIQSSNYSTIIAYEKVQLTGHVKHTVESSFFS
jgi:hypothetical protein